MKPGSKGISLNEEQVSDDSPGEEKECPSFQLIRRLGQWEAVKSSIGAVDEMIASIKEG